MLSRWTKSLWLAVLVAAALGLGAQGASAFNGTLHVSANPRYFTDNSNKPILLTGSHTWSDLQDWGDSSPTPTFNYSNWLDLVQNAGQNFFRLWSWENTRYTPSTANDFRFTMNGYGTGVNANSGSPWNRSATVCCAADGGNKFDLSTTTFNQGYFDRLHDRVDAANARGLYVGVMLFQGWSLDSKSNPGNPWNGHPFKASNNVNSINGDVDGDGYGTETHTINASNPNINAINDLQKAYIRKVVDTVNGYDNVLYEISNEDTASTADTTWQNAMIDYLRNYESGKPKQHPIGMTAQYPGGSDATLYASHADWVSPSVNYTQNAGWVANVAKVTLSDTDHVFGFGGDAGYLWEVFLRGANPLYMDVGEETLPAGASLPSGVPSDAQQNEIRRSMGQMKSYADRMDLTSVVPHGELTQTTYALADPGNQYLVLQPSSGSSFWVNMQAGTYTYEWLNVATNTTTTGTMTATAGNNTFTPPFSGYAVLYLKKTTGGGGSYAFLKGVNLNGGAVTVEGNTWLSQSAAATGGFSTDAPSSDTQSLASLVPSTDAGTRSMLESVIYRSSPPNGQGFRMSQTIANGTYQVYFWAVENWMSNARDMDVKLEGTQVATAIGDLGYQHWQKYGPYTVTVTDGSLTMDILRHSKGDPDISGFAIYAPTSAPTFTKGINLGGGAVTIDGNNWLAQASASGFSTTAPSSGSGSLPGLTPTPVDSDMRSMLESGIYRSAPPNGQGFTMSQTIANGTYQVYLWTAESYMSNFRDMDIKLEGTTVATAIGDLPYQQWQRYGPYTATVSDGSLTIDVLRHSKGDPVITGLAIYTP